MKPVPATGWRAVLKDIGRVSAESHANGQYARIATLLLLMPPAFGMLLGGALIALYKGLRAPVRPDDFNITLGMCGVSGSVVLAAVLRSWRVRRGSPTQFPRLSRFMPYAAGAGILLGLIVALNHAR